MTSHHTTAVHDLLSDDKILDFVFTETVDDVTLYAPNSVIIPQKPILPIQTLNNLRSEAEALDISTETLTDVKLQEIRAIALIERGYLRNKENNSNEIQEKPDFKTAEEILTKITQQCPNYPSVYNNRAQLNQLYALALDQIADILIQQDQDNITKIDLPPTLLNKTPSDIKKQVKMLRLQALSDLNQCIQLIHQLYPLFSPSGSKDLLLKLECKKNDDELIIPQVLVQALTQRALLHKLRGNEMLSFQDFQQASSLGSKLAQEELNSMNTFELLNKQTVQKLMSNYFQGLHQNSIDNQQQLNQ